MSEFTFADAMAMFPGDRTEPEYKSTLPLVGIDGNAFSVIAQVRRGLKAAGAPPEYIAKVQNEMMDGDYDHLLAVAIRYTEDA